MSSELVQSYILQIINVRNSLNNKVGFEFALQLLFQIFLIPINKLHLLPVCTNQSSHKIIKLHHFQKPFIVYMNVSVVNQLFRLQEVSQVPMLEKFRAGQHSMCMAMVWLLTASLPYGYTHAEKQSEQPGDTRNPLLTSYQHLMKMVAQLHHYTLWL